MFGKRKRGTVGSSSICTSPFHHEADFAGTGAIIPMLAPASRGDQGKVKRNKRERGGFLGKGFPNCNPKENPIDRFSL